MEHVGEWLRHPDLRWSKVAEIELGEAPLLDRMADSVLATAGDLT